MANVGLIHLVGSPEQRGIAQAQLANDKKKEVQHAISMALRAATDDLTRPEVRTYLAAQRQFLEEKAVRHMEEIQGIASGFGLTVDDIFTFLHLSFLTPRPLQEDGCSTITLSQTAEGPIVGKNRDYRGEHKALQRVFLHYDPHNVDKRCLFVGSLGAPGAFSSGMNSNGLALADTRIAWPRPGVGWLRYFLMTELLWQTDTVEDAVALIRSVPHVGGGSIALADASGCVASVELGSREIAVKMSDTGGFVHTNHFLYNPLSTHVGVAATDETSKSSFGRLDVLSDTLPSLGTDTSCQDLCNLLSRHDENERTLCRHEKGGEEFTISSAIYSCRTRRLLFCGGNPCSDEWQTFEI